MAEIAGWRIRQKQQQKREKDDRRYGKYSFEGLKEKTEPTVL